MEELLSVLEKLKDRLEASGLSRTCGLLKEMGDDCTYFRKSLDLFLRRDVDEISSLIDQCKEVLNKYDY